MNVFYYGYSSFLITCHETNPKCATDKVVLECVSCQYETNSPSFNRGFMSDEPFFVLIFFFTW